MEARPSVWKPNADDASMKKRASDDANKVKLTRDGHKFVRPTNPKIRPNETPILKSARARAKILLRMRPSLWAAVCLLVTAHPLEPDLIITKSPLQIDSIAAKCASSSCWIGVANGITLFLDSPLLVPYEAHVRLTPWPLFGRASLVAVNGSQLGVVEGVLNLEALDLSGSVRGADNITNGGCIAAGPGATLNVTNSSFMNCTTLGSGGALSIGDNAHAYLRDIRAVDGVAVDEGGLIYAAHNATVIIDGASILSLAYATSGGIIAIGPFSTLDICGTTVLSNGTARHIGGIIKAGFGGRVTLRNDTLLEYGLAQEDGGCVYAESEGTIVVQDNAMLRFCSADIDGGGIKSGGNVSLSGNAVVSGCTALFGGGVVVSGAGAVVAIREAAEIVGCAAIIGGGIMSLLEARIVLRDYARITVCTANDAGGGIYGEGTIFLAGDAVISQCSALLPNYGQGGGIYGVDGAIVKLHDRAQVVECQVQGEGGCILAPEIFVGDRAHVGHCTAHNTPGFGIGACLVAFTRIVMRDFATLTHCYADASSAFALVQMGTILLSGNAMVSDCKALISGAVVFGFYNTTVVLQDDATITRAHSLYGNFHLSRGASLMMTGRALIHECVADYASAVFADQAHLEIHGENKIVNCRGNACCESASSLVAKYRSRTPRRISLYSGATLVANGLLMKNCSGFNADYAGLGGGIYVNGAKFDCENVVFEACTALAGGAVYALNASLIIKNASITGCSTPIDAGGIYLYATNAAIFNSALQNNHADGDGGCIYASAGSRLVATNTILERCSSGIDAGGIGALELSNITLIDVQVRDCWSSGAGGGVGLGMTITLRLRGSTTISNCYAATLGGGIFGSSDVFVELSDRASIVDTSAGMRGGACYLEGSSVIVLRDITGVMASRAGNGGGCHVHSTSTLALLDHASIVSAHADNKGGGVLATDGSIVQLLDAAVIANSSAGGNGGAVAAQASTVYVRGRVVISRNRASFDGGGIALERASQLFASSSRCRWFEFTLGTQASALISTGEARLNKPDAIGQSLLVQLQNSFAPFSATRHFCLLTNQVYTLEAYSYDALGWGGATVSVSSDPEVADASNGSRLLGVDITLTVDPGDHAVVEQFVVPRANPDYEGAPVWESNEARRGGALAQLQHTAAMVQGASFRSNDAISKAYKDGGGGACFIDSLVVFSAYDTDFQDNHARSTGGAVDALPKSAIYMSRVTATGNHASGSGGFARIDTTLDGTMFQHCTLLRNEARGQGAKGGAMFIVDAPSNVVVLLRNMTFDSNHVDGTNSAGGGLAIRASNVELEDVHFLANEARIGDGGALALLETSESTVSIMSNEGCAQVIIEIDFRFTSATCLPLESYNAPVTCDSIVLGCAYYQDFSDSVRADVFDNYYAFVNSQGISDDRDAELQEEAETFLSEVNRSATGCAGCGCWIREERYVVLRNTSSQIAKVTPGAAAVIEYRYCLPSGTYSLQAYDELGESWWNGTYRLVVNGREYDGPAVRGYESPELAFTIDSSDVAIPPSTMENNTASSGAGGAVFIDDGVTDQTPQGLALGVNGLETNVAYYGSAVASPARRLQAASAGTVQAESGYQITAGALVVELIDAFDQRCTSIGDEVSVLGRVSPPSTFTNSLAVFAHGVASFDRAIFALNPGGTLVVNISSSLATLLVSQVTFVVALALCSDGTVESAISASTSRCLPCNVGQYWHEGRCHKCREGMDCSEPGLTLIQVPVSRRRYRATPTSKHVYKCPSKGSGCPGGRATGKASCAEGYTGALCAACERGYFVKPPGGDGRIRCGRCDDSKRRIARTVLAIGGILLFFGVSLLLLTSCGQDLIGWILAEPDSGELGEAGAHHPHLGQSPQKSSLQFDLGDWDKWHFGSGLVKLKEIVAIYQMLAAMRDMFGNNFEVPSIYAAFSMFMSLFGFNMDRILPIRCLVQNLSNRLYYIHRLVVVETLPLAIAAMLFVIALFGRTFEAHFRPYLRKPSYRITVQMAFFFIHVTVPTCTFAAISSLVCDKYDYGEEGSKRFLRVATDINCDSSIYKSRIYPLGVFSVLIFPTAVIVAYAALLYCYRAVLNNTDPHWDKFIKEHSWPENVQHALEELPPDVVKKSLYYQRSAAEAREPQDAKGREMWFQFLWSGYRPDCYMFELVDLSKRLFFTAILSLFWPGSRLQMTLALLVAICFIDYYTRYRPFLHRGDELLAAANNWVLAVSQLVGLMINTGIGFSKESAAARVLLVGAACVPIVVLLYVLRWWFHWTILVPTVDFVGPRLMHYVDTLKSGLSATCEFFSTRMRNATQYCRDVMYRPVGSRDSDIEMKAS